MTFSFANSTLAAHLPEVRGKYEVNAPLGKFSRYQVGGPAEVLFTPEDAEDMAKFMSLKSYDAKVTVLGMASNVLIRDGGVPGVVVRIGKNMADIRIRGSELHVGAGAGTMTIAAKARDESLQGMEFLSGIPGAVGGALRMNAGAFGREMKDIVTHAKVLDSNGMIRDMKVDELGFAYRGCGVPDDYVFVSAVLRGSPGPAPEIQRRMREIQAVRESTQPIRQPSGGSVFKNPPTGPKAWELIDKAGCRGMTIGGAQVSELHCNFIVNSGSGTAEDIETLAKTVRRKVKETSDVELEWEIKRIGVLADGSVPKDDQPENPRTRPRGPGGMRRRTRS